jgi:4-hydroxy-4-methyl-2-oxoglutarate aldolase
MMRIADMTKSSNPPRRISTAEMLELRRWNTPTIYNGWEQVTAQDPGQDAFNPEETIDFMPQMGAMTGRAITVVCEPGNPVHKKQNSDAMSRALTVRRLT